MSKYSTVIRIIAVIIGISLFMGWPVMTYGITILSQLFEGPEYRQTLWLSIGFGSIGILTWALGLAACISLFMLKPFGRWLVLAYFIIGLVSAHFSWIPYASFTYDYFSNPVMKIVALELPNLVVVIVTFILFSKMGSSANTQQPQVTE